MLREPDESDESKRVLMRHRNSGKLFENKQIPPSMSEVLFEDALREKNILQECRSVKQIPKTYEFFKEDFCWQILIQHISGKSLRELMRSMNLNCLREAEVRKIMFSLLSIVKEMHDLHVKHNNINLDTVLTKRVNNRLDIKLAGFENACLVVKKRRTKEERAMSEA